MTDQHPQALLDSSAAYCGGEGRVPPRDPAAQRDGLDDAEIARVTGLAVPMIAAVLRTP